MKIPDYVFKNRIKEIAQKMSTLDLSCLVVYSTGSMTGNFSTTHGYMRYLCGWDGRNLPSILIITPQHEPILLVSMRSSLLFAKETLCFEDIRAVPKTKAAQKTAEIVNSSIRGNKKAGYIGMEETPVPFYELLARSTEGIDWVDANNIIDEQRIVKDELQIAFHQYSADVCDAMFETLTREIPKGKRGYQLQADMEHTARYMGCEHASSFLSVGPVADRPRYSPPECYRVPQKGDQILAALFVIYQGHWGHAIRTGTLGSPSKEQSKVFDVVLEMEEAALGRMKPGMDLSGIWIASERVLHQHYPDARDQNWYWLKTGHSLGLDYNDPILSDAFPNPYALRSKDIATNNPDIQSVELREGMLFELHPNLFVPDTATGVIGDMVLVSESGPEILNRFSRQLLQFG